MNDIKIIIAGDLCPHDRVERFFCNNDHDKILDQVRPVVTESDYSLVNLEAPIATEEANPIPKWGPNLRCDSHVIDALKYAGFQCVTLANNHFYDYGESGALTTFSELRKNGIDFVGAGKELKEAAQILYKQIKGKNIAFINCCEHEYSIATNNSAGSNPLNPIQQYYAIKEACQNSDFVIVITHGGIEAYQLPTPRMQETYRFFIDAGADIVVNHHQHCYSGFECYKGKYIYYGLGNFCFDWAGKRNCSWNEGFLLAITFTNNSINCAEIPYVQCNERAEVSFMNEGKQLDFQKKIKSLNACIANPIELEQNYNSYVEETAKIYDDLHPYSNRYLRALYNRGLIPSFFGKEKLRSIENKIVCESHYDRFVRMIRSKLNKD